MKKRSHGKPRKYDEEFFNASADVFKYALLTLKNDVLRDMCRHQLLPVSGNKTTLADRLYEYFDECRSEISINKTTGELTVRLATYKK